MNVAIFKDFFFQSTLYADLKCCNIKVSRASDSFVPPPLWQHIMQVGNFFAIKC